MVVLSQVFLCGLQLGPLGVQLLLYNGAVVNHFRRHNDPEQRDGLPQNVHTNFTNFTKMWTEQNSENKFQRFVGICQKDRSILFEGTRLA